MGWDCSATYYSSTYGDYDGADGGVGSLVGNAYNNSYPGYSLSFVPSGSADGTSANYDQIITVVP